MSTENKKPARRPVQFDMKTVELHEELYGQKIVTQKFPDYVRSSYAMRLENDRARSDKEEAKQ